MPSDKTLDVRPGSLDSTSMRYHELWLQRWLYSRFFVREGYPIPVVFSTPMDAFSHFKQLWADEQNPFAYLLNLKDANGTPLYEPHPSPVRYPLISVMRKGLRFRSYQNFSIHNWKHINWPTISDEGGTVPGKPEQIGVDLKKCDLAHVTTSRMPMAFDYKFQIDHFCLRPDTQAFYLERLINQFWRSGGGMQSWMDIEYPGWGTQYIRIYVDGEIDQSVPEEYQDKNVEFRTSYNLVVEGFSVDVNYAIKPAVWMLIPWSGRPQDLTRLLEVQLAVDLRPKGFNLTLEARPDVPPAGDCQKEIVYAEYAANGTAVLGFGDQAGTNAADNAIDSNRVLVLAPTDPLVNTPSYTYGIASTLAIGYGTFMGTTLEPVSGTILDSGTQAVSFFEGSYAPIPIIDGGTFTDSGSQQSRFLFGSMDVWVWYDTPVIENVAFSQGTYALVTIPGGTFIDSGTAAVAFSVGTYNPATVSGTVADSGTSSMAFQGGTYLLTVIDGGTHFDSGTSAATFQQGTYTLLAIAAPDQFSSGSQVVGFYSGTYA